MQLLNALPPLVPLRSHFGQRLGYLAWIVTINLSFVGLFFLITGGRTPTAELEPFRRVTLTILNAIFGLMRAYLSVRRLHDFNQSGWWYVAMYFICQFLPSPYAGYLSSGFGFALLLIPGTEGANRYGVRQVVKRRADDGIPTLDGRPPFDLTDETDEKPSG